VSTVSGVVRSPSVPMILKDFHDGLEKGGIHPHIVGVVVPLIIDHVLSPLSPIIS